MDSEPTRLYRRLLEAVGAPVVDGPSASDVADAILTRAPTQLCLMLDDVHRLRTTTAVEDLLDLLPLNGHLLLSSRVIPPVPLGRLDAAGELLEIDEDRLRFSTGEIRRYARVNGMNADSLAGLDGWPAFMALAGGHSEVRSRRYLTEEIISSLDENQRRAIAILSLTEGSDDGFVEAVTGWDPDRLVAGLPLVRRSEHGWHLHDLWGDLLVDRLDPDERSQAISRAVHYRIARGLHDEAIQTAAAGSHTGAFRHALLAACLRPTQGPLSARDLEGWIALAPAGAQHTPEMDLARGLLAREFDPGGDPTVRYLSRAAEGFRAEGRAEVEAEAAAHLGYPLYLRGDREGLTRLYSRAAELAEQGVPGIEGWTAFARGVVALQSGDSPALLEAMSELQPGTVPRPWLGLRDFLVARALIAMGRPGEALPVIGDRRSPVAVPGSHAVLGAALWYSGSPEAALARGPTGAGPQFGARDRFLAQAYHAVALAFAGRRTEALASLDSARAAAGHDPSPITELRLRHSSLITGHVIDAAPEAVTHMNSLIDEHGFAHPLGEMIHQRIAWHYVTSPELRDRLEARDLGPSHREALALATRLVALRHHGPSALDNWEWPPPGVVAANLPVTWAAELALAGASTGRPEGRGLARWLCENWGYPAREAISAAGRNLGLEAEARRMLRYVPSPPEEAMTVAVLGPVELWRGGEAVVPDDWRRERVRELALYLVTHRRARREEVASALWPGRSPDQADQNLRRTLAYLNSVLEPDRRRGDAPWFLRPEGDSIVVHPSLGSDLDDFESLLSSVDAAEAEARAADAITLLDRAVRLRRGVPGEGVADHHWADELRRDFDRRFAARAVRLAQLREARGQYRQAVDAAEAATTADPWNEEAHLIAARAQAADGNRPAALALLDRLGERLGELGLTPGPEARELLTELNRA